MPTSSRCHRDRAACLIRSKINLFFSEIRASRYFVFNDRFTICLSLSLPFYIGSAYLAHVLCILAIRGVITFVLIIPSVYIRFVDVSDGNVVTRKNGLCVSAISPDRRHVRAQLGTPKPEALLLALIPGRSPRLSFLSPP